MALLALSPGYDCFVPSHFTVLIATPLGAFLALVASSLLLKIGTLTQVAQLAVGARHLDLIPRHFTFARGDGGEDLIA